ncbi:hypothetical protein ACP8HZ_11380 [Francisella noatunensis]
MKESSKYSLLGFDETKINDKELKNAKALNSFNYLKLSEYNLALPFQD